ncbi:hypothetical protein A5790_07610 [Mycobacterium sp. 852002-51152_SCH6134967]|uniref:hypothetical protein n=1 Tax=Mycobacterium sp. 852002-51152_SCH6134967 TaxID=1834096 RepID=UPI0007FEB810|nr:hypothetical protein [Mycobacterium sp. 852002-51152_SCH6134967]OBF95559.1 hypothetical protein A5790_07610 [Mycobacterium sp. 852002-51152_SCH6134967]
MNPEPQGRPDEAGQQPESGGRPDDVDTGFWLWVVAVVLMVVGQVVDLLVSERADGLPAPVLALSAVFIVIVGAVALTFQFLMRQGYRWARTVLTGAGVAAVVYAVSSLFGEERPPAAALAYAVTAILGSVLIVGGVYLLHRKDANDYFTR